MRKVQTCLLLILVAAAAFAQKPVIAPGGIVNAAGYYGGPSSDPNQAPAGSIISIFGTNLSSTTQTASGLPLPTALGGTTVTVNGRSAPIFYVSPTQINIQVPEDADGAPVQRTGFSVTTAAGQSDLVPRGFWGNFQFFTLDGSGCGRAAVWNISADGKYSLNSPANSASPGDYIAAFGTGLGAVRSGAASGYPAPALPVSITFNDPRVVFDAIGPDVAAQGGNKVAFAGRAPGFVGVDQVNIQIPTNVRQGCSVPITLIADGSSQTVPISITTGGGTCVDPPATSYGQIAFERRITSGTANDGEQNLFTAAFRGAPGIQAPAIPAYQPKGGTHATLYHPPACPIPDQGLDAGQVRVSGDLTGSAGAAKHKLDGQTVYVAELPNGSVRAGTLSVSGSDGINAGAFEAAIKIGSDIQLATTYPPGTNLSSLGPFTLSWSGGDPTSWVSVTFINHFVSGVDQIVTSYERASAGTFTIPRSVRGLGVGSSRPGQGELVIEVSPDPADIVPFTAPALSLGGRLTWKYTHRFAGITFP